MTNNTDIDTSTTRTVNTTESTGTLHRLGSNGVCLGCKTCATVVRDGHHPVNGNRVTESDDWVRCDWDDYPDQTEIVCLCGSTRFKQKYNTEKERLEENGKIVLTRDVFYQADEIDVTDCNVEMLDELHREKVDRADRIHIINVGGYVGESTREIIKYAQRQLTEISWLEPQITQTPPEERETDRDFKDWRCASCGARPRLKHEIEPEESCRRCNSNEWYVDISESDS